jgi:hypothetical protein
LARRPIPFDQRSVNHPAIPAFSASLTSSTIERAPIFCITVREKPDKVSQGFAAAQVKRGVANGGAAPRPGIVDRSRSQPAEHGRQTVSAGA